MAYVPQNLNVFTAAFAGALSGMGASNRVPVDENSGDAINSSLAIVAGAFAIQFDTVWGSAVASTLDVETIEEVSEGVWQNRQALPLNARSVLPVTYDGIVKALIALVVAGESYFAGQGIVPPPLPVPPSLVNTAVNSVTPYACPAGVSVHDVVYLAASDAVDKADNNDASKQPVMGIVFSKVGATSCLVRYDGELTGFAGLSPGETYYLDSMPGMITHIAPTSPGSIVQRVGFARNTSTLAIMIDRDFEQL